MKSPPSTKNTKLGLGDLVKVKALYHLGHLEGELGVIMCHYGCDPSDSAGEYFYEVALESVQGMVLKHSELDLVSKAEKKNNENR